MIDFNAELEKDMSVQNEIHKKNEAFINKLCRKYFGLGRKQEVDAMANEFNAKFGELDKKAAEIEAFEKEQLNELMKLKEDGPIKAEMIEKFQAIIDEVNARHSALFMERKKALFDIHSKWISTVTEA